MRYSLQELKQIMKDNGIKGRSFMLKREIIDLLNKKQLLPKIQMKPIEQKVIEPKYQYLKHIRNNPRQVTIDNTETGDITTYSSLYRAERQLHKSKITLIKYNNKIIDNKYKVTII